MKICIFYTSPKLGDLFLQLPFIKAIAKNNNQKVSIFINKHLSIKNILEKQDYIDEVFENPFRRGKFFLIDIYQILKDLKLKNFGRAYIFEKTKGAAIACKLARINQIYGFGIGSQKYFVEKSVRLNKNDLRYNYTEQSIKFLKQLNIPFNFNDKFLVLDNQNKKHFLKKFTNLPKPWVCFSVDSTEVNRIWPQQNFAELGDKLIEKKLAKTIFVVNYENHKNYFEEVINKSKYQNQFVNCKHLNRPEIINLIDVCEFFVGIDSGPSCVSGALRKKTFCIIGPTDMTLPRFLSMKKIVSDLYDKKREVGVKRCGDNFIKNDSEVKTISVQKVFDTILENL